MYGKVNISLPDSVLTFTEKNNNYNYKLTLNNIQATDEKNKVQINYLTGQLFISKSK